MKIIYRLVETEHVPSLFFISWQWKAVSEQRFGLRCLESSGCARNLPFVEARIYHDFESEKLRTKSDKFSRDRDQAKSVSQNK